MTPTLASASSQRRKLLRSSGFDLQLVARSRLRCGKASGQHAEWGAGYVVHSYFVAELDGGWVAAVLATDANFEVWTRFAAALYADANQFAYAVAVDYREGILFQDSFA